MRTLVLLLVLFLCNACKNSVSMKLHRNNLAEAQSPYLRQHQNNPVHWQAWRDDLFEQAQAEGRLVIISIGYSACHWCHVMEKECFEDSAVAEVMNAHFISVKVDREENPDVDEVYMTALQLMSGQGGWPLNVVALPDGRPVWGATYVPRQRWIETLEQIQTLYQSQPEKFETYAQQLAKGIQQAQLVPLSDSGTSLAPDLSHAMVKAWKEHFDREEGGANRAPKFPLPGGLAFLLHYGWLNQDQECLDHVALSLDKMALGGIYDQIGGGYARYSVDAYWKVPHFEKMLYDNAQLIALYSQAFRHFKEPLYETVVRQSIAFAERELQSPGNAFFYSALDADSEGEEGRFYVWTEAELRAAIPSEDWPLFAEYYQIKPSAVWEKGRYILHRRQKEEAFTQAWNLSASVWHQKVELWHRRLLENREERPRPSLDDKSIVSWNALMLSAYTEAYRSFGDDAYLQKARALAAWLMDEAKQGPGLWHSYRGEGYVQGLLEDYSFVIQALLDLYSVDFQPEYLQEARSLFAYAKENFRDRASGFFYTREKDSPALIAQSQETSDNVIPSANAVMALNLFRLGQYDGDPQKEAAARQLLGHLQERMQTNGESYYQWGRLLLRLEEPGFELAVVGPKAREFAAELQSHYLPQVAFIASAEANEQEPLLKGRYRKGKTLLYLCQNHACQRPVEDPAALWDQLAPPGKASK